MLLGCIREIQINRYGMHIYRIANRSVHRIEEITFNLSGRKETIEKFIACIRNLSTTGIHFNTYIQIGNGIWTTGQTTRRDGIEACTLDINHATER